MIEVINSEDGKILNLRLNGKLLHADYATLVPKLEAILEKHGDIRCLLEMEDFAGFEMRALWDEIKFDTKHASQFERCAIVGNRQWERWMTKFSHLLFRRAEIRYFEVSELDAAREWIREGLDN